MKILSPTDVKGSGLLELGLTQEGAIDSREAIVAMLRRSAGFGCPCPPRRLVDAVMTCLRGLVADETDLRQNISDTLEAMIGYGDLIEAQSRESYDSAATILYLAPPAFVRRKSGDVLLMGLTPDATPALTDSLQASVVYSGCSRRLSVSGDTPPLEYLKRLGLIELSLDQWLDAPPPATAAQYLADMNRALNAAPACREVPGLRVIDASRSVRSYRARWVQPDSQTGRYVGRRSRAYGADLWCYAELETGKPIRFLDLPLGSTKWRGCDAAWHLQAAIDRCQGTPQRIMVEQPVGDHTLLRGFTPVPSWAPRRWEYLGEPVSADDCLFGYRISRGDFDEERSFMITRLWMEPATCDD